MSTPAEIQIVHRRDATGAAWEAFIHAMHSGAIVEIDEEMWTYWLNVLPPKFFRETLSVGGVSRGVDFCQAEGYAPVVAFWRERGAQTRYFCQQTDIMNPDA